MLDHDSRTKLRTVNYLDSCTRKASKINAPLIHDHAIDRQFVILKHLASIVSFAKRGGFGRPIVPSPSFNPA